MAQGGVQGDIRVIFLRGDGVEVKTVSAFTDGGAAFAAAGAFGVRRGFVKREGEVVLHDPRGVPPERLVVVEDLFGERGLRIGGRD